MISKHDNIAEYILQMWQMEDLVRAFKGDEALRQNEFLTELQEMMQREGVMEKGHTQVTMVAIEQLQDLHAELYREEATYRAAWMQLMPAMTVLKAKTDRPTMSDMEICLTFLYEIMLLSMQKREISAETRATQQQVSNLLRYLAAAFQNADQDDPETTL